MWMEFEGQAVTPAITERGQVLPNSVTSSFLTDKAINVSKDGNFAIILMENAIVKV